MKDTNLKNKEKKGVALIISVGVLALIAMIATSFAINMQIEYRGALNYLYAAKAEAIAQAGIDKAIADIRNWASSATYSTLMNNIAAYPTTETTFADGSYEITTIEKEEGKVNINALDLTDYIWIDRLSSAGLTYADIGRIIDYRDADSDVTTELLATLAGTLGVQNISGAANNENNAKNASYATIEEVRLVLNDDSKYDSIKDIITASAPIIKGGLIGKYYQDNTSFSQNTILDLGYYKGKVIELGSFRSGYDNPPVDSWAAMFPGADTASEACDAEFAGSSTVLFGFNTSGVVWTGFIYIPQDKVNQVITFYLSVDDGGRLYIDGEKIIESWGIEQGKTEYSGTHTFQSAGWHPIKIDYVEAYGWNQCEFKWDGLGSKDYVPAEYLGYYPTSYYGKVHSDNPADPYITPSVLGSDYNSGGIFKVVAKGRVKNAGGTVLAEKQITTILDVFGTWTQTTKAEFYAAWASLYDNFSDGEIRNVNWQNSCPTDSDSWSGSAMLWDQTPTTVSDSLKLGYWCNFDEDLAWAVVTLRGGKHAKLIGWGWDPNLHGGDWDAFFANPQAYAGKTVPKTFHEGEGPPNEVTYDVPEIYYWQEDKTTIGFGEVAWGNWYSSGSYVLKIQCARYDDRNGDHFIDQAAGETPSEDRDAELDGSFYSSKYATGPDLFIRTQLFDNGQKDKDNWEWGRPPSTRIEHGSIADASVPPWIVGWLTFKETPYATPGWVSWYTLLKNGSADWIGGDLSEITMNPGSSQQVSASYPMNGELSAPYVLAVVGKDNSYQAYYSNGGLVTGALGSGSSTDNGVVKFKGRNVAYADTDDETAVRRVVTKGLDWCGDTSTNEALFDNIRVIYPSGYFVSTPFVAAYPADNANIKWGTVSWTADTPDNTSITMYARAGDTLATTDTFSATVTSGGQLSGFTGKCIQYKALLQTTTIDNDNYPGSGVTPVLKDVTVTYLPRVGVLYRQ